MVINALIPSVGMCLDQAARKSFIASLTRGETFENDGQTYAWLPTLRGVKTVSMKSTVKTAAAAVDETTVEQKGPYTIYSSSSDSVKSAAVRALSVTSAAGVSTNPIALNLRTNSLAVITGNIWLKLKNMQDTQAIGKEYRLIFSFSNTAMSTSFYSVPVDTDIAALRQSLLGDSRIISVTLDMVDRIRRPR
jgi:hypothetical protein